MPVIRARSLEAASSGLEEGIMQALTDSLFCNSDSEIVCFSIISREKDGRETESLKCVTCCPWVYLSINVSPEAGKKLRQVWS